MRAGEVREGQVATRPGAAMDGVGVDLVRVEGEQVVEVWLFTADLAEEDAFWGRAAKS
ncbi:hypothetical protein ACVDFE_22080 [Lentzea chajnantorensis]